MHNEVILHRLAAPQSILISRKTRVAVGAHDMTNIINMNNFMKYKHI
jgi:hypothetical protein